MAEADEKRALELASALEQLLGASPVAVSPAVCGHCVVLFGRLMSFALGLSFSLR